MKKVIVILTAIVLTCSTASAQSGLTSLLGKLVGNKSTTTTESTTTTTESSSSSSSTSLSGILSSLLNGVVGATANVTLNGTYTYTGTAITLESENTLSSLASSVVETQVQQKLDEALKKVGISEGALSFTFASDSTFTCTIKNKTLSGTYTKTDSNVKLEFGNTLKYLTAEGVVVATTDGIKMVFEGDKFLAFMKQLAKFAGSKSSSSSLATIGTLLDSYDGLNIGFNLKK